MQNIPAAFQQALIDAPVNGIRPRQFIYVSCRDGFQIGFWTGHEDVSLSVISAETGGLVERTYLGGHDLEVGPIGYVTDLTAQSVDIGLSQISDAAQSLVRGHDVRLAIVDIHESAINDDTGRVVSDPTPVFRGVIDASPLSTPDAGGVGGISLTIRSELMLSLMRTNPAKASHAHQTTRFADQFAKYAASLTSWSIKWGAA